MKTRMVMVVALVVLAAGSVAACRAKGDNNDSSSSDVTAAMGSRDRTTSTRHEIGCASRRRCF